MKKFLSMLLALTLVISALMGVTVLDVSATSVSITPASDSTPRQINVTVVDSGTTKSGFATGEWSFVQGAETITDSKGGEHLKGETTKFATITQETVLGKKFDRFQFEPVTAYDTYATANYFRLTSTAADIAANATSVSTIGTKRARIFSDIAQTTFLPNISSEQQVYRYTFYAYSGLNTNSSQSLSLQIFSGFSGKIGPIVIDKASRLYSAEGIPHKIDILVYSSTTDKITGKNDAATGSVFSVAFVDGVYSSSTTADGSDRLYYNTMKSAASGEAYHLSPYFNLQTATGNVINIKETDMYIESYTESRAPALEERSVYAAGSATNPLFVVPEFKTTNSSNLNAPARTDENVVYGVAESADTILTSVLTSRELGTRKADFTGDGLVYLSDIITNTSNTNVTAVSRTTGEQIPVGEYSDTKINNALLIVNGVYVLPTGAESVTVTRGIKPGYISKFESAADGGKIDLYSNLYVSELFEANETNDVLIKNIPVIAVYNGTEYTNLAAMTDVLLKDVTFKFNGKTFGVTAYASINKALFNENVNRLYTRIRRTRYTSGNPAEEAFGGLKEGFLKLDSEPRSSLTFSTGVVMYDQEGYYQFDTFPTYSMKNKGDYNSNRFALNANDSRYFTANFEMYLPDYDGNNARLQICPGYYNATGGRVYTSSKTSTVYFVTRQKNHDTDPASRVLLAPNTWNNISIVFDGSNVADGIVTYSVYVNGELSSVKDRTITNDHFKVPGAEGYVSFDYFRFYPATYTSMAIKDKGYWYYGKYTPNIKVADTELSIDDARVTVDNESNKIITEGMSGEDLVALLAGTDYNPLYSYSYASSSAMTTAFNEVDDKKPTSTTNSDGNYVYTNNKLIDRWVQHAYDPSVESGVKSDATAANNIVSITKNEETGHYTLTIKPAFNDNDVYDGVATSLDDIIEKRPELREEVLIGVAVTDPSDPDSLPRVYTWVQSGAEIDGINVTDSGEATLYYSRYGNSTITGKFILAGYDENRAVKAMKILNIADIISVGGEGADLTISQKFDTVPNDVVSFRAFLFDGLSTLKPLTKATNYVSVPVAE